MNAFVRTAVLLSLFLLPICMFGQQTGRPAHVRSSAAYAEVLLRKTEVKAELESIAPDYSENSSRIVDLRSELEILERAVARVAAVRIADSAKLTVALGKLLVKKAAIDAELARLSKNYKAEHPEVKRATIRSDIFEAAIREVLP